MSIQRHRAGIVVLAAATIAACQGAPSATGPEASWPGAAPFSRPAAPSQLAPFGLLATLVGGDIAVAVGADVEHGPDLATDPATGESLVVYALTASDFSFGAVYGQRVAADGTLVGAAIPIASPTGSQSFPAVAFSPADQAYLVVWDDTSVVSNIHAQRVAVDGTLVGGAIPITADPFGQQVPAVAYDPVANRFLVTWHDTRNAEAGMSQEVYGAFVTGGGLVTPDFAIAAGPGSQSRPQVAYSTTDQAFLVVWDDTRTAGSGFDVYGQQVASDGTLAAAGNFPIATGPLFEMEPTLAYAPSTNQFLVAWRDDRDVFAASAVDIHGRLATSAGVLGPDIAIAKAPGWQSRPDVAFSPADQAYLVTFQDDRNDVADVWGQRVEADGAPSAAGNFAISAAVSHQVDPALAHVPTTNTFLVTWSDTRSNPEDPGAANDVYAQRVGIADENPTPTPTATPSPTPTPTATPSPTPTPTAVPTRRPKPSVAPSVAPSNKPSVPPDPRP